MAPTVGAHVPVMPTEPGIGEAARRVALAPSAIRYDESEGLLDPPRWADGRRRYGPDELRVLAFIALARDMGIGVAGIGDALHPGPDGWAHVVDAQVAVLDARIARATRAKEMLLAGRDCPAASPSATAPTCRGALDALLAGTPLPDPGERGPTTVIGGPVPEPVTVTDEPGRAVVTIAALTDVQLPYDAKRTSLHTCRSTPPRSPARRWST